MAKVAHEPTRRALERLREISADEEARRLAFVRERALRDEVSLLNEAKREGEVIGIKKGEEIGIKKGEEIGIKKGQREAAAAMIQRTGMDDATIADITGLSLAEVQALRNPPTEH